MQAPKWRTPVRPSFGFPRGLEFVMIIASDLKEGMAIRIDGQIYKALAVEARAGAAKLSGVVRTKLRNVSSGRGWEPHFRPDERLEDLVVDRITMEFLFSDSEASTF
jgi:elongation factor P